MKASGVIIVGIGLGGLLALIAACGPSSTPNGPDAGDIGTTTTPLWASDYCETTCAPRPVLGCSWDGDPSDGGFWAAARCGDRK